MLRSNGGKRTILVVKDSIYIIMVEINDPNSIDASSKLEYQFQESEITRTRSLLTDALQIGTYFNLFELLLMCLLYFDNV